MAIQPYMPTCHADREAASALIAAIKPSRKPRLRIGTIVKYWKMIPRRKANAKSTSQVPKIRLPITVTGTAITRLSASKSPRAHPLPQCVVARATSCQKGRRLSADSSPRVFEWRTSFTTLVRPTEK